MTPITFAVSAFIALVSAGVGYAVSATKNYREQKLAQQQLDLAKDNLTVNEKVAQQNFDLSKDQFEYQKQLNDTVMQREDTAFQRQVADLKAAGLSPLNIAGGSPATALTSANAPQLDMSGINTAMSNIMGAYNDLFNRKMQRQQFALQSKVQAAQCYTQLAEAYTEQKKAQLDYKYLDEKLKWEKSHGFRDLDWRSELLNFAESLLNKNPSSTKDKVSDIVDEIKDTAAEAGIKSPTGDIMQYGLLPDKTSPYAHNFDFENYGNDRDSWTLAKEETKEKAFKMALRIKDTEDNRVKLYNTDDYLKKHISLENWKKASEDFVKYYLKKGMFEGHKKYFD